VKLTATMKRDGIVAIHFYDKRMDAYLCTVSVDKCVTDAAYQRKHDSKHSERMKGKDLLVWPYPIVSHRDTCLYVVDGQHRIQADNKRGVKETLVVIKFGMSKGQEAGAYAELNTMKRPNKWNQFKARLTNGEGRYKRMAAMAEEVGFTLLCLDRQADLRMVSPMEEAWGISVYDKWLLILSSSFVNDDGRLEKAAAKGAIEFQRGVIDLLRKYGPAVTTPKVLSTLKRQGIALIRREADAICKCGRTLRGHYLQAMENLLAAGGALKLYSAAA
jgi:hypothetical protein